jgi:hypothetical protein
VVVAVGLTVVEPPGNVDVNVPGVMKMLADPVVAQLSVLLDPDRMAALLAVKELMTGLLPASTVTVTVVTVEPAVFVAVNV